MIRPRQFLLRGSVEAVALLVDDQLGGHARVLALWEPGTSVHRVEGGHLLRLPRARRMVVDRVGALPFVEQHGVIASAPLASDEVESFARAAFVLVRGAGAKALAIGASIDPAEWIDVEDWSIRELEPLGPPPAPAILAVPPPPAAHEVFGRIVGPPPAQRAAVMAALRAPEPTIVAPFAAFATRVLTALSTTLKPKPGLVARTAGPARGPSTLDWIVARMQDLLARLLVATRLAQLVGRRQAAYVEKLFDLFEKGDLEEALRHAIPLDGESAGNAAPALGVPGRRNDLAIRLQRQNGGSSLGFGENLFMTLRRTYRAALEKLEREGRIDEAAFVLAELLKADEEAVAFLERHGRYRLAADIADARDLAPELRVRQRFLAGDREHAIALARAHGGFSGAITRLERSNLTDAASALRLEWADLLAEGGDYAAAVDTIWPMPAARPVALRWIDLGVELGGVAGARMLARKIALDGSEELLDRVHAVLQSPDGAHVRHAFARELLLQEAAPIVRLCARAAARAIYADAGREDDGTLQRLVRDLVDRADDAALRADRPTWPPAATTMCSMRRDFARFDAGTTPISDAALLPDGRTVVALGEAGVRVISRTGRVVTQFDQPADHLVISDRCDRAIAVARRGEASRLARIDLLGRRSEPWCEARLGGFAHDFDGTTWIAGEGDRSLLVDVLSPDFTALRDFGTRKPFAIARTSQGIAILAADGSGGVERSTYELPSHQLRSRAAMRAYGLGRCAIATDTSWAALSRSDEHVALYTNSSPDEGVPIGEPRDRPATVALGASHITAVLVAETGTRVLVFGRATLAVLHELFFEGSTRVGVRVQDGCVIAWDDRGRVIAFDTSNGRIIRDLRL